MARKYIGGAETGDLSEVALAGTGFGVDGTVSTKGGWSYKATGDTDFNYMTDQLDLAHPYFKSYVRFNSSANPTGFVQMYVPIFLTTGNATLGAVMIELLTGTGAFKMAVFDSSSTVVGSKVTVPVVVNQWHRVDIDFTVGAGTGAIKCYFDGTKYIDMSNQQFGSTNFKTLVLLVDITPGDETGRLNYFDDVEVDDAGLIGESYILARQFEIGTPNQDNWTKV